MINFLLAGTLLGLSAGFAPGPLLALVVTETLQHGTRSGLKVALAPVITDLPIIGLTLLLLRELSGLNIIMGIISGLGGLVVLFLGVQAIGARGGGIELPPAKSNALLKGITVNFLSPHPYLFWLSVGGPLTLKAGEHGLAAATGFVLSFYVLLVGAKLILAVLVGRSRSFLAGRLYLLIIKGLGLLLILLGLVLCREGFLLLSRGSL
ncbi:MAG: LysE family transporter [Desulfurivibrionaceae bacterium]|nr:LysE family transporter [Desulfurivibrionaceae bacterium]